MPSVKQFFSYYVPTLSKDSTSEPSISHFRQSTREATSHLKGSFRKWGYKSNAGNESTAHITQGSRGVGIEDVTGDGIMRTHDVHISIR
jgi:hypothetical protein